MKKKLSKGKLALIILGSCTFLWNATFATDAILVQYQKRPVFAIKYPDSEEASSETYIGLFYVVYVYERPMACPLDGPDCETGTITKVELHSWFYSE